MLSALDEIHRENLTQKEESLRAQTIQEILSSEVKYLRQLEIIMQVKMNRYFAVFFEINFLQN